MVPAGRRSRTSLKLGGPGKTSNPSMPEREVGGLASRFNLRQAPFATDAVARTLITTAAGR